MNSLATLLINAGASVFLLPKSLAEDIRANSPAICPTSPLSSRVSNDDSLVSPKTFHSSSRSAPMYYSPAKSLTPEEDSENKIPDESPPLRTGIRFATPTLGGMTLGRGCPITPPPPPPCVTFDMLLPPLRPVRLRTAQLRGTPSPGHPSAHLNRSNALRLTPNALCCSHQGALDCSGREDGAQSNCTSENAAGSLSLTVRNICDLRFLCISNF